MLQTVNVSGRSVAGRVLAAKLLYIKFNFSETFVCLYIGNDTRELFFIQNGLRQEELIQTKAELDANLRFIYFYAEARNKYKDGGNYSRNTLLGFRNGLERYLKNPPYSILDPLFVL